MQPRDFQPTRRSSYEVYRFGDEGVGAGGIRCSCIVGNRGGGVRGDARLIFRGGGGYPPIPTPSRRRRPFSWPLERDLFQMSTHADDGIAQNPRSDQRPLWLAQVGASSPRRKQFNSLAVPGLLFKELNKKQGERKWTARSARKSRGAFTRL